MGKTSSSSSSSISSNSNDLAFSTASSSLEHLPTDLRLGLSISPIPHLHSCMSSRGKPSDKMTLGSSSSRAAEENDRSLFVKVYMEGIPIGRKLDLLAQDGYHELIKTLQHMFDTTIILGSEMEEVIQPQRWHVLTYEDEEGDLIMVGDIPWEMFLSTVKRLKITRVDAFGC